MSGRGNSNGAVRFMNASGGLVNMKEDGSWPAKVRALFEGGWLESSHSNFHNLSKQLWSGNLQTAASPTTLRGETCQQ